MLDAEVWVPGIHSFRILVVPGSWGIQAFQCFERSSISTPDSWRSL